MTKTFQILPDLTCPELAGYKLPPYSRCQEDGVVSDAWASNPDRTGEAPFMYKAGYTEAREKYEFSREDLMGLLFFIHSKRLDPLACEVIKDGKKIDVNFWNTRTHSECMASDIVRYYIESISRTPIAIEVDFYPELYDGTETTANLSGRPALNPDGTVKVVKWIFNE